MGARGEGKGESMTDKPMWKVFTHDFCSPIQGGKPIWDGSVPFVLPAVTLDDSDVGCGAGWNFVDSIASGFQIAGMWPSGRPSSVFLVEPSGDLIQRGGKWRSSGGKILRLATQIEITQGVEEFSKVFNGFESEMASEQLAWRYALGRPESNEKAAVEGLEKALRKRGLKWTLKKYETARATWAAWATRDAWATWDARDARDALTQFFVGAQNWVESPRDFLTAGIRDAYANGLELALPTEKDVLGYALARPPERNM